MTINRTDPIENAGSDPETIARRTGGSAKRPARRPRADAKHPAGSRPYFGVGDRSTTVARVALPIATEAGKPARTEAWVRARSERGTARRQSRSRH